jgi:hypothetical protein
MIKHTAGFSHVRIILFSAGIFISSVSGQTAQQDSAKIANSKQMMVESAETQPEKGVVNTATSAVVAKIDSSVQNDTVKAVSDSSATKNLSITVARTDSSVQADSAVKQIVKDSSSTNAASVSAPVSPDSIVKSDTVASIPDSSVKKDSSAVEKVAVPEATPFADSSKSVSDSAKTIKAEVAAVDSQSSKQKTEEKVAKKEKKKKDYNTVGTGIMILAGTSGPEIGLIGSVHQFLHCPIPINIRAMFSYLQYKTDFDQKVSDQKLAMNINSRVSSADLLLDFHPLKNWLRISAGAFFSFTETKAKMRSKDGKSIGLITVTPEEMGSLEFTFSRHPVEPYLGIGVGNALEKRVSFLMDLGVVYTGPLKVKGSGSGMIGPSSDNAKNLEKVFEKHNELFWWPVLSLGVGIKLF